MSIDNILKHVEQYLALARESENTEKGATLPAASRELEAELRDYKERRSRVGAIRSILVAVDDSEPAQWAADEAVRLAHQLGARISLLHVIDAAPVLASHVALDAALNHSPALQAGHGLLTSLADRVPPELLDQQLLREGPADKEIVLGSRETGSDLVVIGTHGRGLLGRFLLGSVAEAVVRQAACPVVTVGHPRDGAAPEPYAVRVQATVKDDAAMQPVS